MGSELRVISGKYRSRALKSPEAAGTHPMGAREKLALFNMVNVEGAKVLDAFAGSGALGIEALSRGAKEVIFVESNAKVARMISENLDGLEIGCGIMKADAEVSIRSNLPAMVIIGKAEKVGQNPDYRGYFDVILADPPYDKFKTEMLEGLGDLLAKDGILAISSPKELGEVELAGLRVSSSHTYARARITILRKN